MRILFFALLITLVAQTAQADRVRYFSDGSYQVIEDDGTIVKHDGNGNVTVHEPGETVRIHNYPTAPRRRTVIKNQPSRIRIRDAGGSVNINPAGINVRSSDGSTVRIGY